MTKKYTGGEYLADNPMWHEEDSPWKAKQILRMLKRNKLRPKSVIEVGCGTGLILQELQSKLNDVTFDGYDISPQAIKKAKKRENKHLSFHNKDILKTQKKCDLMMFIDLIEHIEDYFSFLRETRSMSKHKILHIPLDLSAQSLIRINTILARRTSVGHIHYFTKELALQMLKDLDYEVVDYFYTGAITDRPARTIKSALAKIPRKLLFRLNKDLTVRTLGGYSLMVLVK